MNKNVFTVQSHDRLGLDLGNTIVQRRIEIPNSLRVVTRLVQERFNPSRVFVVSRVNEEQKLRAETWLKSSSFHSLTGIPSDHVHFCTERRDKGPICAQLGITHFVDDRTEVLLHMPTVLHKILFRPSNVDRSLLEIHVQELRNVRVVESWIEIEAAFGLSTNP